MEEGQLTARNSVACVVDEDAVKFDMLAVYYRHCPASKVRLWHREVAIEATYHIWLLKNESPSTTEFFKPLKVMACGRPG